MGRLARAVVGRRCRSRSTRSRRRRAIPTRERLRKAKNLEIAEAALPKNQAGRANRSRSTSAFNATPLAIRPGEIELSTGTIFADLVVTCIGYTGVGLSARRTVCSRLDGPGAVPTGTIPTNRADSHAVAQQVITWLEGPRSQERPRHPMPLAVDVAGWHRIDKAEVAAGAKLRDRPRVKLTDWQALLDIGGGLTDLPRRRGRGLRRIAAACSLECRYRRVRQRVQEFSC